MGRRRIAWIALAALAAAALGLAVLTGGLPETDTARAERLAAGIRCPTCQGLSAAESDAKAAAAVRDEITRRVAQGQSDEEIRQSLVDRYGREILLRPEGEGLAALIWAIPVAAFVVAAFGLVVRFRRRPRLDGEAAKSPPRLVRRVGVAAAVLFMAAGAGAVVARTAGERLPGESATGTVDLGPAELLVDARARLANGQAVEALRLYDLVLEEDPNHPEALAYRGWLVRLAGEKQHGMDLVETAIAADPEYPDAHLFRGVMLLDDLDQPLPAAEELRRFLALAPASPFAEIARQNLARAEREAAA